MNITITTKKEFDIYQILLKFPMRYADEEGQLNRDHNSFHEYDKDGTPIAAILIDVETGAAYTGSGLERIQDGKIVEKTCDANQVFLFYKPARLGRFVFSGVHVPPFIPNCHGDTIDMEIKDGKIVGWEIDPQEVAKWIQEQEEA